MLKANSKKVLDIIAGQTQRSATKAYMEVYQNATKQTAQANSSQLMAKPEAQIYLQAHIDKAKQTIVSLMDSEKEEIKFKSAESILNRELGTPTQRIETKTTGVTLTIDLTSALSIAE